ncbi:MAG: HAD-IIB family hydrolase [Thiogranum sp.]
MSVQLLLCTDLDRTLLPNGPQPESEQARRIFSALAARPEVTLAYVTGRDRQLVKKAIAEYCLPTPDFIIGDVGTTIYEVRAEDWHPWSDWQQEIAPDWAGLEHSDISDLLGNMDDLQTQEAAKQNRHKVSFYVPLDADTEVLSRNIGRRLDSSGIRASLVWSIDEPHATGLLDILPASASKQHAISFLMQRRNFTLADTVFAGDSGNDLPVLASGIPAVLVANASADVRGTALQLATAQGHANALYIAQGGFMGMNGNYSAGVLEGVVHFRPEVRNWLPENTATVDTNDC